MNAPGFRYRSSLLRSASSVGVRLGDRVSTIRVLDALTGDEVTRVSHPFDQEGKLAFSPDGEYLTSSGKEHHRVWEVPSGRQVLRMCGGNLTPAFSPDGSMIVAVSPSTASAKVWFRPDHGALAPRP